MEQHYSAFISYKHAPADIAVASEIQKRLERYHVPAAIRKKTGKEKIGRIFRDKEELPITSDLSDDISKALEDADYLIVICSASTKLSTWVPREIDYFLKNHTKKQVLTVLVDGEPQDVIPSRLLSDTVTRTNPDGTTYEEEVIYEPLSCDFRAGIKESRRVEIPRLAAALLGCTYDELVRREHQYKRRRNLAIGIPAACMLTVAIAYLIWSRNEISKNYQRAEENYQLAQENYQKAEENYKLAQDNYEEAQANLNKSLINQSSYLASESRKLLNNGDRLHAILLAMEALPDESADADSTRATRPETAAAQSALVSALQAYMPEGTIDSYNTMATVAEFPMEGRIADFMGTKDGHYVVVRDYSGNIGVWDVQDLTQVLFLDSEEVRDVRLLSNTQMVLLSDKGIASYDLATGKELWRFSDPDYYYFNSAISFSSEGNTVWAAEALWIQTPDYTTTYCMRLLGLDASTGEITCDKMLTENPDKSSNAQQVACSKDGRWVAVSIREGYSNDGAPVRTFLYDTETETVTELALNRDYSNVDSMIFFKDTDGDGSTAYRLAIMAYPLESYGEGGRQGALNLNTIVQPMEIVLSCYDPSTAGLVWENSYFSPQLQKIQSGRSLGFSEESGKLLSLYGNKIAIIQPSNGQITDEEETTASIVSSGITEKDVLILYLDNGNIGAYYFDDPGKVSQLSYFSYDLRSVTYINQFEGKGSDLLVVPESNCVWLCRSIYDEEFVRYEGESMPYGTSFKGVVLLGDTLTILDYDSHLYLYDLSEQRPITVIDLPAQYFQYELLGGDPASGIVWVNNNSDMQLLALNVADGTLEEYQGGTGDISYPRILADGTLVYRVFDYPESHLVAASAQDGVLKETVLMDTTVSSDDYYVRSDLKAALIKEDGLFRLYDLSTGESTSLEGILQNDIKQIVWQSDGEGTDPAASKPGNLAVTDGNDVVILKPDGEEIARLSQTGSSVVNMTGRGDELIVLFGGGLLTRYSWDDAAMIGRSTISHYDSDSFNEDVIWDFEGNTLYLIRRGLQCLMHIIDLDSWEEETPVQYGIAYDANRDRIVSFSNDGVNKYIGYFPHYSVSDLFRKAKEALHGTELTEEERAVYGLKTD